MLRRFWDLLGVAQVRRDLVFLITAAVTVFAAPGAALKAAAAVVLLVAFASYVLITRGPAPGHGAAVLLSAGCSIASLFLSHDGIGEVPVLLATVYARTSIPGERGRLLTGLLGVAFGVAVAWISRSPVGLLAGLGVPLLAIRQLEEQQLQAERDRAVRLLSELEQARDAQAQAAALEERGRIAREMHDVLAHSLAGLSLQLQAVRAVAAREEVGPAVTEPLDRAAELARIGVEEAKAVVGALRESPPRLGMAELAGLVERFPGEAELAVTGHAVTVDDAVGHALYRGVQESLTNAARYAPGSAVRIEAHWSADLLRVRITDSGPGDQVAVGGQGGGHGLRGMRERFAAVGGDARSGPLGSGWQTELVVPLHTSPPQ